MKDGTSTRLPGSKYREVFDRGRSARGRLAAAWCLASDDAGQRAGVVVSKKTFRRAVDRNRAKRLVREAYRLLVRECAAPEHAEWVFAARRSMGGRGCREVKEELRCLMSRTLRQAR